MAKAISGHGASKSGMAMAIVRPFPWCRTWGRIWEWSDFYYALAGKVGVRQ